MKKNYKWLGNSLLISYLGYLCTGGIYRGINESLSAKDIEGYYNKDPAIISKEIYTEKPTLDFILQNKEKENKTNITLNVIVHEHVKAFFDNKNNQNDDALWVRKVINTMEGLEIYEKRNFNFVIKHTYVKNFEYGCFNYYEEREFFKLLKQERDKLEKADLNLFFMPEGVIAPFTSSNGVALLNGDIGTIFLTKSDRYNQKIIAHEMGHLLGLEHPEFHDRNINFEDILNEKKPKKIQKMMEIIKRDFFMFFIDPFHFYPENVMKYGKHPSFDVVEEDEPILEKARKKFKK